MGIYIKCICGIGEKQKIFILFKGKEDYYEQDVQHFRGLY